MGVPLACRGHVLVENYISTRSAHFSTVFFHTCLKLGNRQSGQAVFAWGRDFHTLFHTLWKTGFCGFVAGCRTGVGYDILCDFCIIGLVCLLGYLVNRVGLWGAGGVVACRPFALALFLPPSPQPPSPPGKGETKGYFMQGASPLASPALTACGTYRPCRTGPLRKVAYGSVQNRQEAIPYEQCRQPRRGGTGGDGSIRRKRRRRLRWSSPPGLGEQVPRGYKPDSKPTAEAAKPILQNPKSQPPSGTARKPQVRAPT